LGRLGNVVGHDFSLVHLIERDDAESECRAGCK